MKVYLKIGLNIRNGYSSILSTVISLGNLSSSSVDNIIDNYKYGGPFQYNAVIASPKYISNTKGEELYLGFPPFSIASSGQQYNLTCILDNLLCKNMKVIPQELIYGYYYDEKYGEHTYDEGKINLDYIENPKHFSKLPPEKQDEFFEKIKSVMSKSFLKISSDIALGNTESLKEIKEVAENHGFQELINLINIGLDEIESRNKMPEDEITK